MGYIIKYGPEGLRNFTTSAAANTTSTSTAVTTAAGSHHSGQAAGGGAVAAGTSSSNHYSSKVQLAELRYGREEMLALFDTRSARAPAELKHNDVPYLARGKAPFALVSFEDSRQNPRPSGMPVPEFNSGRGVWRTPLSEFGPGRAASRTPLGAGDRTRDRPMNRHGTGRGAGVLEPRPSWNTMNNRSRFPLPTAEDPPRSQRPWNNSASGNRLPGEHSEWHNKVFKSKRPDITITNWRHRDEGGDECRASDLGRSRSNNNPVVEREWGDCNRRTWASGDPRSAHDELPEWFDNPDAGAGTFDASGAFHGASADDADDANDADDATPPKVTPLTRSHTHATFERSEDWWVSEKAHKLSTKSKQPAQTQVRQRSVIRFPEEMKTEDEILAQLRASQVSESANNANRLSPNFGDLHDIIQLSPSPATLDGSKILIWAKDTFALVKGADKGSIRDLRKKAEEAKVAEEAERKRKEEERLAADEEKNSKQHHMMPLFPQHQAAALARDQAPPTLALLSFIKAEKGRQAATESSAQQAAAQPQEEAPQAAPSATNAAPWANNGGFWESIKGASKGDKASTKSKKESTAAEFDAWCETSLSTWSTNIDVPTFVNFLRIESPYEVKEYIKYYLGETKEADTFARNFLERRSKLLSSSHRSDDLCSPAAAVNPRPRTASASASASDYQEVKAKGKRGKNKMLKVHQRRRH